MKRRINLLIAFVLAVALHAGGLCAINIVGIRSAEISPALNEGESSVALTLVSAKPVEQPEPEVVPEPLSPEEPPPEEIIAPELVVAEEPPPREEVKQPVINQDADLLVKGVEEVHARGEVRPRYPLSSRLRGEEGNVTVAVQVVDGVAVSVEVTAGSGFPSLDREAVRAAKEARFVNEDGSVAIKGESTLTFHFQLSE